MGGLGEHMLFKMSGWRGFSVKVTIELRVKCGKEVSPEDLWHKSSAEETIAHAK